MGGWIGACKNAGEVHNMTSYDARKNASEMHNLIIYRAEVHNEGQSVWRRVEMIKAYREPQGDGYELG